MPDISKMTKVLYCDDDREMLSAMGTYLFWYGFYIDCIHNSSNIVRYCEENTYDALIISYWCEPVSCEELCRTIRSYPLKNPNMSILVVAPEDLEADQYKVMKENDIYFMTKFRGPEKWFGKIRAMVRMSRKETV